MIPPAQSSTRHLFTVDVEEYFHVSAFESVIDRQEWTRWPPRLGHSIPVLLDLLARFKTHGTFFVLGWVARHSPDVVRRIVAAGHEVASHGFWHQRVMTLSAEQFRADVRASKAALEDLTGVAVHGYRAPSFSIVPGCEWAFDVLVEEGFSYDSSVFPIRRPGYGYAGAPRIPHVMRRAAGELFEFPLATLRVAGLNMPSAGGGYLRHFPLAVVRRGLAQADAAGTPATFYLHPWEIDPDQPRVPASALTRLRHYRGLERTLPRLERLLGEFAFTNMRAHLDRIGRPSRTTPARSAP